MLKSVSEIHGESYLEPARVHRVVGHREVVVVAYKSLIYVGEQYVKPCPGEFHVDIGVHKRVVAALNLMLVIEGHGGWLISGGVIAGIVVAVNAELNVENPGYLEQKIEVGVDCEFRQRNHALLS